MPKSKDGEGSGSSEEDDAMMLIHDRLVCDGFFHIVSRKPTEDIYLSKWINKMLEQNPISDVYLKKDDIRFF